MNDPTQLSIYRLRAVLNGVSPLVWRRFLLSIETSLADLHKTLQLSSGWSGFYLYEFCIHGKSFGSNAEDPRSVCLGDFQLRPAERFRYRYNFLAFWESDLRLEVTVPLQKGSAAVSEDSLLERVTGFNSELGPVKPVSGT